MSIEALNWARKIYVGDAMAKALLRGIADYADEHGHCFPSHGRLSTDCEMSIATVKRRLAQLEELDLLVTFRCWVDEHGVRNRERRGRETSREIRLHLAKRIAPPAPPDDDPNPQDDVGGGSASTPSNPNEGGLPAPHGVPAAPPGGALVTSPNSEPSSNLKDSPLPPSGGSVEADLDDGWKEFEADWQEPILRQSIAQREWAKLSPEQRITARQAARGYIAYRKAQRKPPNVIGAQAFLRECDAWPKFATYAPELARATSGKSYSSDSPEADAIRALYATGRAAAPFEHKGRLVYPQPVTPQLLAFAQAGSASSWEFIELGKAIAAWSTFLDAHIFGVRSPFVVTRGDRRGIFVPWLFPPSVEGKVYPIHGDTGLAPDDLMTDADYENFDR
jgi:hypothetical protein